MLAAITTGYLYTSSTKQEVRDRAWLAAVPTSALAAPPTALLTDTTLLPLACSPHWAPTGPTNWHAVRARTDGHAWRCP